MAEDIKKGLLGIVVDETTVSQVMPDINSLTYRGYAVQDLCAKCNFEEVAYLVLNGELPNKKQLKNFIKEERSDRKLSKEILMKSVFNKINKEFNANDNGHLIISNVDKPKDQPIISLISIVRIAIKAPINKKAKNIATIYMYDF